MRAVNGNKSTVRINRPMRAKRAIINLTKSLPVVISKGNAGLMCFAAYCEAKGGVDAR